MYKADAMHMPDRGGCHIGSTRSGQCVHEMVPRCLHTGVVGVRLPWLLISKGCKCQHFVVGLSEGGEVVNTHTKSYLI